MEQHGKIITSTGVLLMGCDYPCERVENMARQRCFYFDEKLLLSSWSGGLRNIKYAAQFVQL